jgi:hypothetical protein
MTHWVDTQQRFPYTDKQPARVEKMTAPNQTTQLESARSSRGRARGYLRTAVALQPVTWLSVIERACFIG